MKRRNGVAWRVGGLVLAGALALLALVRPVHAMPPLPSSFYGTIVLLDDPNPVHVGDVVQVTVPDQSVPPFTTTVVLGADGLLRYTIDVNGDEPSTPGVKEGGSEGDPVTFKINGRTMAVGAWHSGSNVRLNFHPPRAVLTTAPAREGDPVSLNAGGSQDAGADLATYAFDCNGDGLYEIGPQSSATTQCPAFPDKGTYNVGLRAVDARGGVGTTTLPVVVADVLPQAGAGGLYGGTVGQPVALTGTPTCVAVDQCTVEWFLGSVSLGKQASVSHTWNAHGTYTVSFRVTDNDGNVASDSAQVTINPASTTLTLRPGWNMVAWPLLVLDGRLDVVLGKQLHGTENPSTADQVLAWDGASQSYKLAWYCGGQVCRGWGEPWAEHWLTAEYSASPLTLLPDAGFWILNQSGGVETLMISGNIADSARSVLVGSGWQLLGSPIPAARPLDQAGLAAVGTESPETADQVLYWDAAAQRYKLAWYCGGPVCDAWGEPWARHWLSEAYSPTDIVLEPGHGFWYLNRHAAFTWVDQKPVP